MKIKITLKDPDGVYYSIQQAAEQSVESIEGLNSREKENLIDARHEELSEKCSKWIEYGEYVSIEIDTENNTAVVLKA